MVQKSAAVVLTNARRSLAFGLMVSVWPCGSDLLQPVTNATTTATAHIHFIGFMIQSPCSRHT
jgi:hypothetical protein